jgi:hypothetical protein
VTLAGTHPVRRVVVQWGRRWPRPLARNVPPAPGPVVTLRPTSYDLLVSVDGQSWRTAAQVSATAGLTDSISLPSVPAQFVRLRIAAAAPGVVPQLQEITVS